MSLVNIIYLRFLLKNFSRILNLRKDRVLKMNKKNYNFNKVSDLSSSHNKINQKLKKFKKKQRKNKNHMKKNIINSKNKKKF